MDSESGCGQFSRGPDRKLQYLAQGCQIGIARTNPITLPEIYARRADADLLGNFRNGKAAPYAGVANVMGKDRLAGHG
jgi:hypothetical protein